MKSAVLILSVATYGLVSAAPATADRMQHVAKRGVDADAANGVFNWISTVLAEAYEKNPDVVKRGEASTDAVLSALAYIGANLAEEADNLEKAD